MEENAWTVHEYNPDLFILRESGCSNYEKPFLYIIFGSISALLLDTGAGEKPGTAAVISRLLERRKAKGGSGTDQILVLHSHGHRDHTSGDAELSALSGLRVTAAKPDAIRKELSLSGWPDSTGTTDLGNRILDIIPIPGHEPASIAIYDRKTGLLFTGDTLYPGRLYVTDWPEYRRSIARLLEFAKARPIAHILGAHIEQSRTPFRDYPTGTTFQPDEHALELGFGELLELHQALTEAGDKPVRIVRRDFTVVPRPPRQ